MPEEQARRALDAMAETVDGRKGQAPIGTVAQEATLAVCDGLYAVSYFEQEGVRAALIGNPQWDEPALAETARNSSPAAALLLAWRAHGRDLLSRLHGPFALAVLEGQTALIAVDRMGIHTLSYAVKDGALVFASTTSAVAAHPLIGRQIDAQGIFNYFYFHIVPSPGSVYQGVEKLLPAQYAHFRDGRLEKGFYWHLDYRDRDGTTFEAHARRFRDLLKNSVTQVAHGDHLGAFLSGGTDSSTVCGVLTETTGQPVNSYSIGYEVEEFDEMEYARIASRHFGCNPHEYYLTPDDLLAAIPVIARTYDEPFANDSAVPVYICARRAAEDGVRVMVAGDGGDEIFGGNARYAKQMAFELYAKAPALLRTGLIEPLLFGTPGADRIPLLRKARSYIRQANIPLPDRLESYNFLYRQPLHEVFEADFLDKVDTTQPEEWLREVYFRTASKDPVNRMMHVDLKFTLADNDLRKVNRMCEAAGVEVRYPMLDERLVEFSGELPPLFKVKGQQLRWFFKQALKDFLPREIIRKQKHGFGLPFGVWSLSHPRLRELVQESLASFERRGYLRPDYVRELHRQHAEVHPTYFGKMVWVVVTLEQWLEAHKL